MPLTFARIAAAVLCLTMLVWGQEWQLVRRYVSTMPLDTELIELVPAKKKLGLMVTWDCQEIEGWELFSAGNKQEVRDAEGQRMDSYPQHLRFRFTIGSKTPVQGRSALPYETRIPPEKFIVGLKFRLLRFHEIETHPYEPAEQGIIGVPPQIPYDERIYSVEFRIPKIGLEDRLALEVLDADGNRVAKFPVFLM
jgi:hypothetical protein